MDLVDAQQARHVLDRIVEADSISPILWKKVQGLSAGSRAISCPQTNVIVKSESEFQAGRILDRRDVFKKGPNN